MVVPPPDEPLLKIVTAIFLLLCLFGILSIVGFFSLGVWKFVEIVSY